MNIESLIKKYALDLKIGDDAVYTRNFPKAESSLNSVIYDVNELIQIHPENFPLNYILALAHSSRAYMNLMRERHSDASDDFVEADNYFGNIHSHVHHLYTSSQTERLSDYLQHYSFANDFLIEFSRMKINYGDLLGILGLSSFSETQYAIALSNLDTLSRYLTDKESKIHVGYLRGLTLMKLKNYDKAERVLSPLITYAHLQNDWSLIKKINELLSYCERREQPPIPLVESQPSYKLN